MGQRMLRAMGRDSFILTERVTARLIAEGVVGDSRAPDIIRFGFTPLFIDAGDVDRAVAILARIMAEARWDRPEFKARSKVT